jgi:hypothetical protein
MQSWRGVELVEQEQEVLDVVFISCAACLAIAGVHNPLKATIAKYVDSRIYKDTVKLLSNAFSCTANIHEGRVFSLTTLKIKRLARIRDVSELFYIPAIPEANIIVVKPNHRFFSHEAPVAGLTVVCWPGIGSALVREGAEHDDVLMPFASVMTRLLASDQSTMAPFCPSCLSELELDKPPSYESRASYQEDKKVLA